MLPLPEHKRVAGLNAEEAKLLQSVHNLSDEITGHLMDPELPERCELMGERTVFFSLRVSREAQFCFLGLFVRYREREGRRRKRQRSMELHHINHTVLFVVCTPLLA